MKSKVKDILSSILLIIFGWVIVVPISLLIPKKKGLFLSISRTGNNFTDNTKYFHLFLIKNHTKNKAYYISETKNISKEVPNLVKHFSLKSIILLLQAEYIILDNSLWFYNLKYHLSIKAKKIQLWHGIGSKKIEMDTDIFRKYKFKKLRKIYGILRGQLNKYFLISSTSKYYTTHLYSTAFRYNYIKNFGQPRNDVLYREPDKFDLIGSDKLVIEKLIYLKNKYNKKIIIYTPTYRKVLNLDLLNYNDLDTFAAKNNILIVIKHHILTKEKIEKNYENIIFYNKQNDIYPLMSISNSMITDYSSIYLDYLLLDKPIIFYTPDIELYKKTDTSLRNDFTEITPGIKCYNQKELEDAIINEIINNKDVYKHQRKEIKKISYEYNDGYASKRIYNFLTNL